MYGNTKDLGEPNKSRERKMELEESTFLTSDHTTKLQSYKQYGTDTKTEIWINGTKNPEIYLCMYGHLIFDKGGKNIQWRKTISSISGTGRTGQSSVKEWN